MMQDLILHSTPKSELADLIREVVKNELAGFNPPKEDTSAKLYTRKEVARIFNISLPTLHEWTKEGMVKAYRLGSRIRYKHEDVQSALKGLDTLKYSRRKR